VNGTPSASTGKSSGCKFGQPLVDQQPVFDRKLKIRRPSKRKKGPKYL